MTNYAGFNTPHDVTHIIATTYACIIRHGLSCTGFWTYRPGQAAACS